MSALSVIASDSPPYGEHAASPAARRRIEECLRRHLSAVAARQVRDAVARGEVVHLSGATGAMPVIAYKRGVLFVAGTEYVIDDE